jgi:hypothetical protein
MTKIVSSEYKCSNCQKTFRQNSSLSRHKLQCGANIQRHKCEPCGKKFDRADSFKRHANVCKGKGKRIIKCFRCDKQFKYKWFLTRHLDSCKKCTNCKNILEDGIDHICELIVKLPKQRPKAIKKTPPAVPSVQTPPDAIAEYEEPPNLWDLTGDMLFFQVIPSQTAPEPQHINTCIYCLPLLPGSADCLRCANVHDLEVASSVLVAPYSCEHCSYPNSVDFRIDSVPAKTPLAPPIVETPTDVPSVETPTAVPSVETSPAVVPSVETPTAVPSVETPLAVPSVETPTAVPSVETPTAVPSVETPTDVPSVETSPAVPSVETPPAVPSVETPTDVPSVETPLAVPSVETSPAVPIPLDEVKLVIIM